MFAAGEFLRIFRADLTVRQVVVLDSVCGRDETLHATALLLRADPRTLRRTLVEALTLATESRPASRPEPA